MRNVDKNRIRNKITSERSREIRRSIGSRRSRRDGVKAGRKSPPRRIVRQKIRDLVLVEIYNKSFVNG